MSSSSSSSSSSTLFFIVPTNQPSTTVISPPTNSPSSHADDTLGFVAPLLGAIAGLGLLAFIALYCIQQMNKPKLYSGKQNKPKWNSLDSLEEAPPPVYTAVAIPSPTKEKGSTSDIMVDSMLRSQYSPQLALSPSLVAGEFRQDTTPPPPLPTVISPSNTLINSSSCLYSLDKKSRFDTYEPQLFIEDSLQDSLKKQ